ALKGDEVLALDQRVTMGGNVGIERRVVALEHASPTTSPRPCAPLVVNRPEHLAAVIAWPEHDACAHGWRAPSPANEPTVSALT
ncbi:MAG TPA: hypothetical protein VK988_19895, partial [Acidimicrobiales bacterium]|nr:hypothetical protein [Acidimicrobiales bacterium]